MGVITILILLTRFSFDKYYYKRKEFELAHLQEFIKFFIVGVTVVVVAVPEGLPLSVMLSLAYSVRKMMDDNNLVRHISACETMGSATTICTDKTGTLTTNRMTVMKAFICDVFYQTIPKPEQLSSPEFVDTLVEAISLNCSYTTKILVTISPSSFFMFLI